MVTVALLSHSRRWLSGTHRGSYRREVEHDRRRTWRAIWAQSAEGVGLTHEQGVAAGVTVIVPPLVGVIDPPDGSAMTLVVEMLRGQIIDDYCDAAARLAVALDTAMVAVVPRSGRTIGLVLHDVDPVAEPFDVPLPLVASVTHPIVLGRAEDGTVIRHALADPAHLLMQGRNGSGKSRGSYSLLGQVSRACDVLICGSDITGLLLGGPWGGTRHRDWQAVGTADIEEHAATLERVVAEMDDRLARMPPRVDKLHPTVDVPLMFVVIEEFPGLLRAAATIPKPKTGRSVLDRIKLANLRLLSEGRKVGVRVLTLAQRAEAETVGGGYAREQYALTVSYSVPADSLVMAHGDDARDLGARHRNAAPGIAVVTAPGHPLTRMRSPQVGEYAEYCDVVGASDRGPAL